MIFVDTGIWYAANVAEDPDHDRARQLLLGAASDLLTTEYVVDELFTLLAVRRHRDIAIRIGNGFWTQTTCELEWTTRDDIKAAWPIFTSFEDKSWSFTDCVSYAVMQRLGVREAFALDEHFKQFGFVTVRP
jgi:predicted nucleic acid-binding protein